MTKRSKIIEVVDSRKVQDGAGVKINRVLGFNEIPRYDPFLLLDFFDSTNPDDYASGFPWHPHRGIETITYLINGEIEHRDSIGSKGVIKDGDCQWMTAASGIIHTEMPKPTERLYGVQIWLNIPAKHKMSKPVYRDVKKEDINIFVGNGYKVKIISGEFNGVMGPINSEFTEINLFDVEIENSKFEFVSDIEDSVLIAFILEGEGFFDDSSEKYSGNKALLFDSDSKLEVKTDDKLRFLLLNGKKIKEEIVWRGPVVMNSQEELKLAFQEIEEGNFVKYENI